MRDKNKKEEENEQNKTGKGRERKKKGGKEDEIWNENRAVSSQTEVRTSDSSPHILWTPLS
jgi:hypothetical protein